MSHADAPHDRGPPARAPGAAEPARGPRVRIERIAAGGEGVGRLPDGRVVFVPRTAPGDLVELTDLILARSFARATAARVLEVSPERVEPPCAHFTRDRCGGCPLQHISRAGQLRAKAAIVGDALRRLGRFDLPDPAVVGNERPFGWRSRMTLTVAAGGRAGFHVEGEPHRIFALERCEIAAPRLTALWDALRPHVAAIADGVGQIVLREDAAEGLRVHAAGASDPDAWERLVTSLRIDGRTPAFELGPPSFSQIDPAMGARVRGHALELLGDVAGRHTWDLYAGIGETSALLAARGATVESVEADARAVAESERRAGPGSAGVLRHRARVEDVVARLRDPQVVVANPPRAGIDAAVLDAIVRRRAGRVVYVSCDPATLARDLRILAAAYTVASVTAFDAFPQTAHVETVAVLGLR